MQISECAEGVRSSNLQLLPAHKTFVHKRKVFYQTYFPEQACLQAGSFLRVVSKYLRMFTQTQQPVSTSKWPRRLRATKFMFGIC